MNLKTVSCKKHNDVPVEGNQGILIGLNEIKVPCYAVDFMPRNTAFTLILETFLNPNHFKIGIFFLYRVSKKIMLYYHRSFLSYSFSDHIFLILRDSIYMLLYHTG